VRLLLDENLSPSICARLVAAGHQAVHVRDLGLAGADDRVVLDHAKAGPWVLVTADRTDFGRLLRADQVSAPSVVLLRLPSLIRGQDIADLLVANLVGPVADALDAGAFVVITPGPIRIRPLPLR